MGVAAAGWFGLQHEAEAASACLRGVLPAGGGLLLLLLLPAGCCCCVRWMGARDRAAALPAHSPCNRPTPRAACSKFSGSKAGSGASDGGTAATAAAAVGGRKGGSGLGKAGGEAALVPHEHVPEAGAVGGARADLNDVEGATITSWQYLGASPLLLKGAEARQALKDWAELLADAHPVER